MTQIHPDGGQQNYFGLYPAIVTDIVDPENLGRVEVRFPWLGSQGDEQVRVWATLLSSYADDDQGLQIMPETDSQVVVGFEAGNLRRPYIVGACWNGREAQPETPEKANNKRVLKTRAQSLLEFDDTDGASKVTLSLQSGHKLVLDDGAGEVTLTHSNGCIIKFNTAGNIEIRANAAVEVTAPVMNVHAATANFDGVINCVSLIASALVSSPTYTPGAGNVW